MYLVIVLNVAVLAVGLIVDSPELTNASWQVVAWIVAEAAVGFAAIAFASGSALGLDAPLLLAAGFLFGPVVAGIVASVGYVDVREFRRDVSLQRALFNRSQISLSVMAATLAFHLAGGKVGDWPFVIGPVLIAVLVDITMNWGLVAAVRSLSERVQFGRALSGLYFGRPSQFLVTYASFGVLAAAFADVYKSSGPWTLVIFGLPVVLARQAFFATDSLEEASRRLRAKDAALRIASERLVDERRDERLAIAAGLHDEVLPPMFKVHLMGQVVKQDLDSGRLLSLEVDVPELVRATEDATEATRRLIGGLRSSTLGARGLSGTIRLLCEELAAEWGSPIHSVLEEVDAIPLVQLLTYQVAREALRNAVRHASARHIDVSIRSDGDDLRLVVSDDGSGFTPSLVDTDLHFGIQLIRERVELCGGTLVVDSAPERGTRVVARIPRRITGKD